MFLFNIKDIFFIKAKTVLVRNPHALNEKQILRLPVIVNDLNRSLISKEGYLRKLAYRDSVIQTSEEFFDDSDMRSDYYLTIVYHSGTGVPLLSSRYYFDRSVIKKCLKGDEGKGPGEISSEEFISGNVFLADRLSGNVSSSIYRKNRKFIFLLYYSELFKYNRGAKFIIMARKERSEKLLKKYLKLGFETFGSTYHKGKEHWILAGDFKNSYSHLRTSFILNVLLLYRGLLFKN